MSQKTAKHIRRIERKVDTLQQSHRTFEECLARVEYEQLCQNNARAKAGRDRQTRRELEAEYAVKHWQTVAYAAILAAILVLVVAISAVRATAAEPQAPADELMISTTETITHSGYIANNAPVFVMSLAQIADSDQVNPKIYNVPLDAETQQLLQQACEERGIDMALALAIIWEETDYRNIIGDDGASFGYMQIQKKWHKDRMARLGVTDLMDPASNFRVGCDYLAELLEIYPLANALAFYNSGDPALRPYCERVMDYMDVLEKERI